MGGGNQKPFRLGSGCEEKIRSLRSTRAQAPFSSVGCFLVTACLVKSHHGEDDKWMSFGKGENLWKRVSTSYSHPSPMGVVPPANKPRAGPATPTTQQFRGVMMEEWASSTSEDLWLVQSNHTEPVTTQRPESGEKNPEEVPSHTVINTVQLRQFPATWDQRSVNLYHDMHHVYDMLQASVCVHTAVNLSLRSIGKLWTFNPCQLGRSQTCNASDLFSHNRLVDHMKF